MGPKHVRRPNKPLRHNFLEIVFLLFDCLSFSEDEYTKKLNKSKEAPKWYWVLKCYSGLQG